MDAKLKVLKVVELKDILAKASVAVPAKANKSDLINRVIANPKALQIYNAQFPSKPSTPPLPPQNDDLLAPPEDVDWNSDGAEPPDPKQVKTSKSSPTAPIPAKQAAKPAPSVVTPPAKPVTNPSTNTVAPVNSSDKTKTVEDEELEKRKRRANRFGVPLVEPPKSRPTPTKKPSANRVTSAQRVVTSAITVDDPERLVARSARFGKPAASQPPTKGGRKRLATAEDVDAEELERRKKRAERFNIKPVGTGA